MNLFYVGFMEDCIESSPCICSTERLASASANKAILLLKVRKQSLFACSTSSVSKIDPLNDADVAEEFVEFEFETRSSGEVSIDLSASFNTIHCPPMLWMLKCRRYDLSELKNELEQNGLKCFSSLRFIVVHHPFLIPVEHVFHIPQEKLVIFPLSTGY